MRAWLLTALLTLSTVLIVAGVARISEPAAWIVAGLLLGGLSVLTLAESSA